MKKTTVFLSGMLTATMIGGAVIPVLALNGQLGYDRIGVRVGNDLKVAAEQTYTAPNGQQTPNSITYTDHAGGLTNYLPLRLFSDLLDADITWDSKDSTVNIAGYKEAGAGDVVITAGVDRDGPSYSEKLDDHTTIYYGKDQPEYVDPEQADTPDFGRTRGGFTEVDPKTVHLTADDDKEVSLTPTVYLDDAHIQYAHGSFPAVQTKALYKSGGVQPKDQYMVFTVTNNGDSVRYTRVDRVRPLAARNERFSVVPVQPGQTLTRMFHIDPGAGPMEYTLKFDVVSHNANREETDLTVSLERTF